MSVLPQMKKKWLFALAFLAWGLVVAFGLFVLLRYSTTPGEFTNAPSQWPAHTHLAKSAEFPTLILFGHPHCPCSEASVGELDGIVAKVNQRLDVRVVFVVPKQAGKDWRNTRLWTNAKRIPKAQTILDEDGIEADLFGARTSGEVLLYDKKGQLVFAGGITAARGHFGDNPGKSSIISFVNDGKVLERHTPVFGCALYSKSERPAGDL
jgi:hypothetical protein